MKFDLLASDDASGNDKFAAHYIDTTPEEILSDRMLCRNHATNLVMTALYPCVSIGLLRVLSSGAAFLRTGTHFFRCILSIHQVVSHVKVVREAPSESERLFVGQIKHYFKSIRRGTRNAHSENAGIDDQQKGDKIYDSQIDVFFSFFNVRHGEEPFESNCPCHACVGPDCCTSLVHCKSRARRNISFLMQSKPTLPILQRWTKKLGLASTFSFWDIFVICS